MTGVLAFLLGGGLLGNIQLSNQSCSDIEPGGSAACVFTLNTDGTFTGTGIAGGTYCTPGAVTSLFEAQLVVNSGGPVSGSATSTWLNLGTTRAWSVGQTGLGTTAASCTLSIREASTGNVRATCSISLLAQVTM